MYIFRFLKNEIIVKLFISVTAENLSIKQTKKYSINLIQEYKRKIYEFYATYLNYIDLDNKISDEEFDNLNHLKDILGISELVAKQINEYIIGHIYQIKFEGALSDGKIDNQEKKLLTKLQTELRLEKKIAEDISSTLTTDYLEKRLEKHFKTERISPQEETELKSLIKNLKIEVPPEKLSQIDKYLRYWNIENTNLPVIKTEFKLQKNELCYFVENAEWFESIGRKQYFEGESKTLTKANMGRWNFVNNGKIHFTSERILLTTTTGNKSIKFEKVLAIVPFSDGIQIVKSAGKDVFIKTEGDHKEVTMILKKIINRP